MDDGAGGKAPACLMVDHCLWRNSLTVWEIHLCVCSVAQLCLTLWDHMDYSPPGSSVHGISQARMLEWVAVSYSREFSWPRDWTHISCVAGRFFTNEPPGKPVEFTTTPKSTGSCLWVMSFFVALIWSIYSINPSGACVKRTFHEKLPLKTSLFFLKFILKIHFFPLAFWKDKV